MDITRRCTIQKSNAKSNIIYYPAKNVTITANYVNYYTISATAYEGGKITPWTVRIQEGKSQRYQITPDVGYEIADVFVNGKSIGNVS